MICLDADDLMRGSINRFVFVIEHKTLVSNSNELMSGGDRK